MDKRICEGVEGEVRKRGGVRYEGFMFEAEDGIRDAKESRGLGDVFKREEEGIRGDRETHGDREVHKGPQGDTEGHRGTQRDTEGHTESRLVYASDAAEQRHSEGLRDSRIINKNNAADDHPLSLPGARRTMTIPSILHIITTHYLLLLHHTSTTAT